MMKLACINKASVGEDYSWLLALLVARLKRKLKLMIGLAPQYQSTKVLMLELLKFNSSVTSPVLVSVQPIRLSKNLTSGIEFD